VLDLGCGRGLAAALAAACGTVPRAYLVWTATRDT
jgi:hypothetical protein